MVGKGTQQSLSRVPQYDTIHTLNFLYQFSTYQAIREYARSGTVHQAQYGTKYFQSLARKATLRIDPSIKRSICKQCRLVLIPGITCSIRVKNDRPAHIVVQTRCHLCGHVRRLPCPPLSTRKPKTIARRRKKQTLLLQNEEISRKVHIVLEAVHRSRENSDDNGSVHGNSSIHLGQRARRRRARSNVELKSGHSFSLPPRRSRRSRPHRRPRDPRTSPERSEVCKKQRRKTFVLPLIPYTERIDTRKGEHFGSANSSLSRAQQRALDTLRGGHVVTAGLSKGGTVGQRER